MCRLLRPSTLPLYLITRTPSILKFHQLEVHNTKKKKDHNRPMDIQDSQSGSRVKLSLRRKRIKLDQTLTEPHPPDDGDSDKKGRTQGKMQTAPQCKPEGEEENVSRYAMCLNTEEPKGLSLDSEVEGQVLCPLCRMDLTDFSITCRQEHANKCSVQETGCGRSQQAKEVSAGHVCVLCAKEFKSEQSKLSHMKQCARKGGISTEALVQLNRVAVESLLTASSSSSNQSNLVYETVTNHESDFKPPMKKAKKQKEPTDYLQLMDEDQLQVALALSASIDTNAVSTEHQSKPIGRKTRQQTLCGDVIPQLLLTTPSESEKLLAARAEMILIPSEDHQSNEVDIVCTPPFPPSSLGQCITSTSHAGDAQPVISKVPHDSACDSHAEHLHGRSEGGRGDIIDIMSFYLLVAPGYLHVLLNQHFFVRETQSCSCCLRLVVGTIWNIPLSGT